MAGRAGVPESECLTLMRIMANCFQWLKGIATIVLWRDDAPRAEGLSSECYLVTGAAPATR